MSSIENIFQAAPSSSSFDVKTLASQYAHHRATDWTIPEAFMCLILSAAVADGTFAPEERSEVAALAKRSRVLKSMNPAELEAANAVVKKRSESRPEYIREACEALPTDLRLSVFAHCVDIILADGELQQSEADFLNRMIAHMAIAQVDAERIMGVLLVKNRF